MTEPSAHPPRHESIGCESEGARRHIRIACCIGDSYTLPLAVMLSSLVGRLSGHSRAELHLLHGDLSDACLRTIGSIIDTTPIPVSAEHTRLIPPDRRFPWEAAAPLLLPKVLSRDIDRVLFIDADVLVLDDISPLWHADLRGRAIGAVADAAIPLCRSPRGVRRWRERGIPPDASYFNAGVMLMDLHAWRERQIADRAIGYLREVGGTADFFHQEALNGVAWNDWSPLDLRWNMHASQDRSPGRRDAVNVSAPAIVHFSGRMKPWRFRTGSRFDAEYQRALERAGVHEWRTAPSLRDRILGLYDRNLRGTLYPLERALWTLRAI